MTLTGQAEGKPIGTASSVVDRYTALHATIGTLAALRHRDRTGEGQVVDVCLLDSALTMVEIPTVYHLATGAEGGEGGRPPYRAVDGWVVISAAGRDMAARLMKIAGGGAGRHGRRHADGGQHAARITAARWWNSGAPRTRWTRSARRCSRWACRRRPSAPSPRSPRIPTCGSARCSSRWPIPWPARCTCRASPSSSRRRRDASGPSPRPASTPTRSSAISWVSTARQSTRSAATMPSA